MKHHDGAQNNEQSQDAEFFASHRLLCHRQPHDRFLTALRSLEHSADASFVHDGDAIAVAENLFHIAADHQNRHTLSGEPRIS